MVFRADRSPWRAAMNLDVVETAEAFYVIVAVKTKAFRVRRFRGHSQNLPNTARSEAKSSRAL